MSNAFSQFFSCLKTNHQHFSPEVQHISTVGRVNESYLSHLLFAFKVPSGLQRAHPAPKSIWTDCCPCHNSPALPQKSLDQVFLTSSQHMVHLPEIPKDPVHTPRKGLSSTCIHFPDFSELPKTSALTSVLENLPFSLMGTWLSYKTSRACLYFLQPAREFRRWNPLQSLHYLELQTPGL